MSSELIFLASVLLLALVVVSLLNYIRITPKCPQCKEIGRITDSNVSEAWLDCQCLFCNYKWRIK